MLDDPNILNDPNRDPIEVLADEFMRLHRERGSSGALVPTIEQFAALYPDHSQDILDLFPMILDLERLKETDEKSRPRPATAGNIPQETLGDFQILSEIGRGGMGVVYLARQKSLGRSVALKVLSRSLSSSPQQVERFQREAEAAAGLHHTNIVPVYGVGNEEDFHYYAMQWIDGIGLDEVVLQLTEDPQLMPVDRRESSSAIRKRFSDSGNLTHGSYFRNVARIGADIADALDYAHQHKVLHRDIKPSNILLDAEDDAWITDFGLAKLGDDRALTQTGELIGTLRYMAPEQFEGHTDHRSDIYSLGLTLYELLTLQPAFPESLHAKFLSQRTRGSIAKPRSINPQVPRDLETIILTACATEPVHRYQSAGEFRADLQRFLEGRPVLARRISTTERIWRWCRRNPGIAISSASAASLLLTVAVVSVVAYFQTHSALLKEEKAKLDAQIAQSDAERSREKAEETLTVAIDAFDSIFENLTRRGVPQSLTFDYADDDQTVFTSVLTVEDGQLLEDLLEFYERFARLNSEDQRLQLKILTAQHRMGLIQYRLGKLDEAEEDLVESLNLATDTLRTDPKNLEVARIQIEIMNDLGELKYRQENQRRGIGMGFRFHEQAIDTVKQLDPTLQNDARIQFQLARAYDLMGSTMFRSQLAAGILQYSDSRPIRPNLFGPNLPVPNLAAPNLPDPNLPGRGFAGAPINDDPIPARNADQPNDRSRRESGDRNRNRHDGPPWQAVEQFVQGFGFPQLDPPPEPNRERPDRRGDRGQRPDGGRRPGDGRAGPLPDIEKSIALLQPLVAAEPANPEFASLLAKALQHRYVYLISERSEVETATEAFQQAERQIRASIKQQPDNPQLVLDLADHLSTASTEGTNLTIETVIQKIGDAITEIEKLSRQFPNVADYQALLASSHRNLARVLMQLQDWSTAGEHLDVAQQQLESLIRRSEDKYYKWSLVATQLDQAQLILEQGKSGSEQDRLESFRSAINILQSATATGESIAKGRGPSTSQKLTTTVYLKLADLYEKTGQTGLAEETRRKVRKHGPPRRMLPFGF